MNKCLLRKLKPFLLSSVASQNARTLIHVFDFLETKVAKDWNKLAELIRVLISLIRRTLRKQGLCESEVSWEISNIGNIAITWLAEWAVLWETFLSPGIRLLFCLAATLDKNRIPERRDFTFEEIKQSLWDRYWPPQRQRCDFVAASAY